MALDKIVSELLSLDLSIKKLGEQKHDSPLKNSDVVFVPEEERVLSVIDNSIVDEILRTNNKIPTFEKAGPREKLFFKPGTAVSAVVTCGGLCPGLNSVIRAIVMMNYYRYEKQITYGIKYGYAGLVKEFGHEIDVLTVDDVSEIHTKGGTILGSSRGNQDAKAMVDRLEELGVNILYTVGGDGTQKGALTIIREIEKRGLDIAVIGIPKTIDNDINFIQRSFGVETAFSAACESIHNAHTEADCAYNGIGLVKLMGRESGFVAANAVLATGEANFCLIPEVEFDLEGEKGLLQQIENRLLRRNHTVIVVAEGAGQKFVNDPKNIQYDASGNVKLGDIGLFLKDKINAYFKEKKVDISLRYIDPSYNIRSCAPTPNDSLFCFQLAQMAVHAGMSGRTGMVVGHNHSQFIHLPIEVATSKRKKIDVKQQLWQSVLEATGQPTHFTN
ncbi:MAG: ATP-dependent 6-phosphofructokinase [Cytophagales bacterium]